MPDQFVKDFLGQRVSFELMNEAGMWHGTLQDVGDQWVKVLVGKNKVTLIPIDNIRSMAVEFDQGENGAHGETGGR